MSLVLSANIDTRGKIKDNQSSYQPDGKEREVLLGILDDFEIGEQIMNKGYEEFGSGVQGYKTLVEYQNEMQKRFNNNMGTATDDPNQNWRANTIRPLTRNKVISIVAHLTNSVIYPNIIAQNEESAEDKDMATVMRDLVEWAGEQSKYEDMFLRAVVDMCVNPAVIIYQDYCKVTKNFKEIGDDGKWKWKEKIDELYSGFINKIVPCDELYISNVYEPDIQKQDFLIRVKNIPYTVAAQKYKDNPNWQYITPGVRVFFNNADGSFYQQSDDILDKRLVQEVTYYSRPADLELRIVNGVLLDETDRPLQRQDKRYPFAKSGYEIFNSRFFYYMPLVAKIKPDQDVIDTLYNLMIDGSLFQIFPVKMIFGADKIDSSVNIPGTTVAMKDPNFKLTPIGNDANFTPVMNVLQKVEASAAESSQDPLQSGQNMAGDKTKYEVQRLETNARTVLGLTGKMIISLVRDLGELIVGCIVQNMPVVEIGEIIGDDVKIKFPRFLIPDRNVDGKMMSRRIDFTTEMPQSYEEEVNMSYDIKKEEMEKEMSIFKINPEAFRRMKYLVKCEPDFLDKATRFYKKLQLYDRAIQNPGANQELILRDFLFGAYIPGEEDKYMASKQNVNPMMAMAEQMAGNVGNVGKTPVTAQSNQQFLNKTIIKSPTEETI